MIYLSNIGYSLEFISFLRYGPEIMIMSELNELSKHVYVIEPFKLQILTLRLRMYTRNYIIR